MNYKIKFFIWWGQPDESWSSSTPHRTHIRDREHPLEDCALFLPFDISSLDCAGTSGIDAWYWYKDILFLLFLLFFRPGEIFVLISFRKAPSELLRGGFIVLVGFVFVSLPRGESELECIKSTEVLRLDDTLPLCMESAHERFRGKPENVEKKIHEI